MKKSLGIYIHIPFCLKKCGYCDFCSFPSSSVELMQKYTERLCRTVKGTAADEYTVDTVYFGGGTPSLLPLSCVEKILGSVFSAFDVDTGAEISLECNPATADLEYFKGIRALGINRLSMGLQSAVDSELALLGRAHDSADFVACLEQARSAGFDNISADLMYGIPSQTLESFSHSIEFLCALAPEHISAYGLTVEEGTEFHRNRDSLLLADDDMQAQMYSLCSERLEGNGYHKYEISNFSRKGFESRHNLRYWRGLDYIGFGVAAHSCFRGERFGNSRDISAFLEGKDITAERYMLSDEEKCTEYVMLRLRLRDGIDVRSYEETFGRDFNSDFPTLDKYISNGFMCRDGDRVAFTDRGFLVSNTILSDIL